MSRRNTALLLILINVEISKSDCALKINFSWSSTMFLCCHRRGFLIIYKYQNKNVSQINLIQPGRQEPLQGDAISWFWQENSENSPTIIYVESKTTNGSASTRKKECKGGNISRCHFMYFTWLYYTHVLNIIEFRYFKVLLITIYAKQIKLSSKGQFKFEFLMLGTSTRKVLGTVHVACTL